MKVLGIFGTSGFEQVVSDITNELYHQTVYIEREPTEIDVFTMFEDESFAIRTFR